MTTAISVTAGWRPPQWTSSNTTAGSTPPLTLTATDPSTGQQTAYVFDGIIRAEHDQQTVITLNPVQTGAAITDNAYIVPPRLVVEIAMSDSMQSYTAEQFAGAPSRSVSAYQTLQSLQAALSVMSIATRLRQYSNMMIADLRADETDRTKFALKASVTFQQIITAQVDITSLTVGNDFGDSAIPQSTDQTSTGQVQTLPVPASIQSQNNIQNT